MTVEEGAGPLEPRVGTNFGRYRIDGYVGRGGSGVVLRAVDLELSRAVALKLLPPDLASDDAARRRFLEESRLAASLDHPSVVPVYEVGVQDGAPFIAMRYVPGRDLARLLRDEAPLSPATTLRYVGQVAAALDAAHRRGLLHGDVKPGNILVESGPESVAYLGDFGLSRRALLGGSGSPPAGTSGFLAPEVVAGGLVDGRADQFGLACVIAQCLTGRAPRDVDDGPPVDLSALPREVQAPIARGMARNPLDRYPDCASLVAALAAVARAEGATPPDGLSTNRVSDTARQARTGGSPAQGRARRITRGRAAISAFLITGMLITVVALVVRPIPSPSGSSPDPREAWRLEWLANARGAAEDAGFRRCARTSFRGGERDCPVRSLNCEPEGEGVQFAIGGALASIKCRFSLDQPVFNWFLYDFATNAQAKLWMIYDATMIGQVQPEEGACEAGRPGRGTWASGSQGGMVACWFSIDGQEDGTTRHWWLAWYDEDTKRTGLMASRPLDAQRADEDPESMRSLYTAWRTLPYPLGVGFEQAQPVAGTSIDPSLTASPS